MERFLGRISPILYLTRVTTAFAAVANVWFVILWSSRVAEEAPTPHLDDKPMWALLLGGAASALGLYSYGTCLNDLLDVRRDRALRPERPLASGQLSIETAAVTVALTLIIAVLGATVFGTASVLLTLALAFGILFFNTAARFVPAVGLVVLGLLYAGHILVPNPGLRFMWPVWLVMTHALIVAAATHVLARKVPRSPPAPPASPSSAGSSGPSSSSGSAGSGPPHPATASAPSGPPGSPPPPRSAPSSLPSHSSCWPSAAPASTASAPEPPTRSTATAPSGSPSTPSPGCSAPATRARPSCSPPSPSSPSSP
ncbi:MAG: UbiA family prenyltransferase [Planctomycetota bacterium]|nr:MAG: UbiA family prenyltransferase [Planctomycetota bacterium]